MHKHLYDPFAEFTKHVLPNGLEVHSVFWDRPWISVEFIIHSGSREDPVAMPGLAHFAEHLVSQNIPRVKFDRAKEFFEICGGYVDFGTTDYHTTGYKFGVPAHLPTFCRGLEIFGSMLLEARLKKQLEPERKIIFQEFNGQYPILERLDWDMAIRKALFKGHRLETWNRPLGRPEGFLRATKADLQKFYDTHYVPANMSVVILGGLPTDKVIRELGKSVFGIKKSGLRNLIPEALTSLPIPTEHRKMVTFSDHSQLTVEQTQYQARWAFPSDFPEQARAVFDRVLGKILLGEIREKRSLAYDIDTDYRSFQNVYEYAITGEVHPRATSTIERLVRECISMVPSRQDLFKRELQSSINRCRFIDVSGSDLADHAAADLALDHRIIPLQEVWDDLHNVTHEQMAEAAALLSPERQYTLIIRP